MLRKYSSDVYYGARKSLERIVRRATSRIFVSSFLLRWSCWKSDNYRWKLAKFYVQCVQVFFSNQSGNILLKYHSTNQIFKEKLFVRYIILISPETVHTPCIFIVLPFSHFFHRFTLLYLYCVSWTTLHFLYSCIICTCILLYLKKK